MRTRSRMHHSRWSPAGSSIARGAALRSCIAIALFAATLPAQVLRGRALLPDSATGVAGATVVILDTGGVAVRQATTNVRGEFRLALVQAGTYELRVLRIGFPQTVRPGITVKAGELRTIDVLVRVDGLSLDTVTILAKSRCGVNPASDPRIAPLWTAARTALLSVRREEDAPTLDIRAVVYSGMTDTTGAVRMVQDAAQQQIRDARLFIPQAADSLAARGYVRTYADSSRGYALPDADVLLSNTFANTHCFGLASSPVDHRDWVGISFAPARDRPGIREVQGAIWLERSTMTLRQVQFRYTMPGRFLDDGTGGGFVDFVQTETGQWIAARWMVRTDAAWLGEGRIRRADVVRNWHEAGPGFFTNFRRVYDYRQMIGASAAVVLRGGTVVFRDDSAIAMLPAHLDGFVHDSSGRAIAGAQVRPVGSIRTTVTDDSGFFRLTELRARETDFDVSKRGFAKLSIRIALKPDSTVHVKVVLAQSAPKR